MSAQHIAVTNFVTTTSIESSVKPCFSLTKSLTGYIFIIIGYIVAGVHRQRGSTRECVVGKRHSASHFVSASLLEHGRVSGEKCRDRGVKRNVMERNGAEINRAQRESKNMEATLEEVLLGDKEEEKGNGDKGYTQW